MKFKKKPIKASFFRRLAIFNKSRLVWSFLEKAGFFAALLCERYMNIIKHFAKVRDFVPNLLSFYVKLYYLSLTTL